MNEKPSLSITIPLEDGYSLYVFRTGTDRIAFQVVQQDGDVLVQNSMLTFEVELAFRLITGGKKQ